VIAGRAAVIGLGLIGGSIARELASRGIRISGFDENRDALDAAVAAGVVNEALESSLRGTHDADIIIIAVPVDAAIGVLERIVPCAKAAALITDVGSTKSRIVAAAEQLQLGERFVGSHPIAGDHRSGWEASRLGLFKDSRVYLCPTSTSTSIAIDRAKALWRELGARDVVLSPSDHDRRVAWTSHLPHVVANAVALSLARAGVPRDDLGPGGRDVTRLSGSSPEMWAAILHENAGAIDVALGAVEREIAAFRVAITRDDADALRRRFGEARAWFEKQPLSERG
jgi:prephenate dehydrogenase